MKETQENLQMQRVQALQRLHRERTEEALWECLLTFQDFEFHTYSGLPYSYHINTAEAALIQKNSGSTAGRKAKALSGVLCGRRIRKCWNCSRKAKGRSLPARKHWEISAELRTFMGFFTSLHCLKCRRKQKKNF